MDVTIQINDQLWADLALHHAAHKTRCHSLTCPFRNSVTPEDYVRWAVELFIREEKPQWDRLHQTPGQESSHQASSNQPKVLSYQEFLNELFGSSNEGGHQ